MTQATRLVRPGYRANGNQILVYDANRLQDIGPDFFELGCWQAEQAVVGEAPGRGTTFFVRADGVQIALRHYKRGGSVGRLINDSYWFNGLTRTRPWLEWHLLMDMHNQGLPVSVPLAARLVRKGLVYRADLATVRIENAQSWFDCMLESDLPGDAWVSLGKLLRKFHKVGVYHHDLNVRNIMRSDNGELFLIDFDKSEIRKPGGWQRGNLARLLRSIRKVKTQNEQIHFSEDSWGQLLQGYAAAM